jgi:hypothetical protein
MKIICLIQRRKNHRFAWLPLEFGNISVVNAADYTNSSAIFNLCPAASRR